MTTKLITYSAVGRFFGSRLSKLSINLTPSSGNKLSVII